VTRTVWKYPLADVWLQHIEVPVGAQLLDVQYQGERIVLWAIVDPNVTAKRTLKIRMVATGEAFRRSDHVAEETGYVGGHLGTLQAPGDGYVNHVFAEFV